jgi:protein TonB
VRHYERPKAPDLQTALQNRLNQGRAAEEQRLSNLRDRARPGTDTAPAQPGNGVPQGNPQTDASGLSGALASRSPLRMVQPRYPMEAQRAGDEGSVRLRLFVGPNGSVTRVEVVRSSGRGYFDRAAASAARLWAFTPLDDPSGGEQWGDVTMFFRL